MERKINEPLDFGWSQHYMALQYHIEEANKEIINKMELTSKPPYAIFSKKYYNEIQNIEIIKSDNDRKYDYCYIGSTNGSSKFRDWIIDFVKNNFTENSFFINTDIDIKERLNEIKWEKLGEFDHTLDIDEYPRYYPRNNKFNQTRKVQFREINENYLYFSVMRNSKFTLCPRGDACWSFRFYEILMCDTIPIVESIHHTYRTKEEAELNYSYYLNIDTPHKYNLNMIEHNKQIFKKYHLLNE